MQLNFFKKQNNNTNEITNEVAMKDYPRLLTVQSFMVGGLVSYEDTGDGVFLLKKETLDKMMPTIEGRPVVLGHQPITLENLEDKAVGYVTRGWFNTETGQFDCEILIKDSDVYDDIKNGNNKVSSAYQVTELGDGGKYLGQDYKAEILDGTFTHLAIVDNPRYPDAKILINSLYGDKEMGLFNKNTQEDKIQITASNTVIEYNGNVYPISELVNAYALYNEEKAEEKNREEKEAEEKAEEKNACKRNEEEEKKNEDSDDELVTKVRKIVAEMLAKNEEKEEEKSNKRNEEKEEKGNEDEEEKEEKKENRNALKLRNSYISPRPVSFGVTTRAERIKNSNAKYSI